MQVLFSVWPEDIDTFMGGIREEDVQEFAYAHGHGFYAGWMHLKNALHDAQKNPPGVFLKVVHKGTLMALGGFDGAGTCWFLCTRAVEERPLSFMRVSKMVRDHVIASGCDVLTNVCWMGNDMHVRFLKALGAEFSARIIYKSGQEFRRFYIPKEVSSV